MTDDRIAKLEAALRELMDASVEQVTALNVALHGDKLRTAGQQSRFEKAYLEGMKLLNKTRHELG